MVFLHHITGKISRNLYLNDGIINQVDNFYQKLKKVPDLLLVYLNITWLNKSPPPVMLSIPSNSRNLPGISKEKNEAGK